MPMDPRGVPLSHGSVRALAQYEIALRQFQSYVGDPIATLDGVLAESPDFVMGHLFHALALFTTSEKTLLPGVEASLTVARRYRDQANERERGLMDATAHFVAGDWHAGCLQLDRVLAAYPRDALALQVGHLMDFYRGDALNLRNRVSRVLPAWDETHAGIFLRARHARVRSRGDEPVHGGRSDGAAGAGARTQGRLGGARRYARDGDAGPHRRRRPFSG